MFDIGSMELMLVAIVALLVLGPERLPEALRNAGLWWGRMRRTFNSVRAEIEREVGMDDVRRQVYNESILADLEQARRDVRNVANETRSIVDQAAREGAAEGSDENGSGSSPGNPSATPDPRP